MEDRERPLYKAEDKKRQPDGRDDTVPVRTGCLYIAGTAPHFTLAYISRRDRRANTRHDSSYIRDMRAQHPRTLLSGRTNERMNVKNRHPLLSRA
jgi:hypothetical protein